MARRKRKAAYIEYDYEAAYEKQLHDLEESNAERMLKEGRVRSVYATKEIRAGEQMDVEIYPEFAKSERELIPDEGRRKKQRQAQRNLNEKNSRKQCERLINENFSDRDIWATFTYTDENMPSSMKEAQKDMTNYIKRINYRRKKKGLKNARYIYVTECSEKGRWHHHIVMDGDIDMDTVEAAWNKGKRNEVRRLQKDENGLSGMAMYITKQKKGKAGSKYQKAWKASKGLRKPEVKKNHYKFKQKDVDDIVTGKAAIEDKLSKWYAKEGYKMTSFEVRYNIFNGRFYISARMHRPPGRGRNACGDKKSKSQKKCKKKTDQKGKADRKGSDRPDR